jgi:hypothetical protein
MWLLAMHFCMVEHSFTKESQLEAQSYTHDLKSFRRFGDICYGKYSGVRVSVPMPCIMLAEWREPSGVFEASLGPRSRTACAQWHPLKPQRASVRAESPSITCESGPHASALRLKFTKGVPLGLRPSTIVSDISQDARPPGNASHESAKMSIQPVVARTRCLSLCLTLLLQNTLISMEPIRTSADLVKAVEIAQEGAILELAPGTFELERTLVLRGKMTLKGAGIGKTTLTHAASWRVSNASLPDPEMTNNGLDATAYFIQLPNDVSDITVSDMTLLGPQVHGAIYGWFNKNLHLHHLQIKETLWSGLRTFGMQHAKIHDCEFVDAGGRWDKGEPGVKGGITGGGIFAIWMSDTEINNNRFIRTRTGPAQEFYGIKVRQGTRCHVHHNTIETNFSMEFPFENDEDNEIDHNICSGTISIPKYAGGVVPKSGITFHIHHNWMKDSYSIEFVRNGVEIDHNLFDFDPEKDHGNLISAFGDVAAVGPVRFHNNLVNNPGRGVMWINEIFNDIEVRNNHVVCRTTAEPRTEGLFGFNPGCKFDSISIHDNRIECIGQTRPLFRSSESYRSRVNNNFLINVSDSSKFDNSVTEQGVGLEEPLRFECGVNGEVKVNGWNAVYKKKDNK